MSISQTKQTVLTYLSLGLGILLIAALFGLFSNRSEYRADSKEAKLKIKQAQDSIKTIQSLYKLEVEKRKKIRQTDSTIISIQKAILKHDSVLIATYKKKIKDLGKLSDEEHVDLFNSLF